MKHWIQTFFPIMGVVFLLAWTGRSAPLRVLQDRVASSVTYEYRVDLNISEATPSIEAAVEQLRIDTVTMLRKLVYDKDDPAFRIVNFEANLQGSCESESDLCSYAQSTVMLSIDDSIDDLVVEYAILEKVKSLINSFNRNHENIVMSFTGPSIVRTDVALLLQDVDGRMSEEEIAVFEETFLSIVGPPLLLNELAITVRSATVFLQYFTEHGRRRLQTDVSIVVSVHVTGMCNGCTSSQFGLTVVDVIDVRARSFQQRLEYNGQEAGTEYFDGVMTSVAMLEEAPGISESSIDIFTPPNNPFPYWEVIVLGVSVVIIITGVSCAACRSRKETIKARNHPIGRKWTADEGEDHQMDSQDKDEPVISASKANDADRDLVMMPHLRKAVHERVARKSPPEVASSKGATK